MLAYLSLALLDCSFEDLVVVFNDVPSLMECVQAHFGVEHFDFVNEAGDDQPKQVHEAGVAVVQFFQSLVEFAALLFGEDTAALLQGLTQTTRTCSRKFCSDS